MTSSRWVSAISPCHVHYTQPPSVVKFSSFEEPPQYNNTVPVISTLEHYPYYFIGHDVSQALSLLFYWARHASLCLIISPLIVPSFMYEECVKCIISTLCAVHTCSAFRSTHPVEIGMEKAVPREKLCIIKITRHVCDQSTY